MRSKRTNDTSFLKNKGSSWRFITVLNEHGYPYVFPLNNSGRLICKFPKEKPRNLRQILNIGAFSSEDSSSIVSSSSSSPFDTEVNLPSPPCTMSTDNTFQNVSLNVSCPPASSCACSCQQQSEKIDYIGETSNDDIQSLFQDFNVAGFGETDSYTVFDLEQENWEEAGDCFSSDLSFQFGF